MAEYALCFKCNGCGKCCKEIDDIIVSGSDIRRIAEFLGISGGEFRKRYTRPLSGKGQSGFLSLITPCPFVKDNRCSIYQTRPKICIDFPCFTVEWKFNESGRPVVTTHCDELTRQGDWINKNRELVAGRAYEFTIDFLRARKRHLLRISLNRIY